LWEPDEIQQVGDRQAGTQMAELGDSLERMNFGQLLLLFGFVISYVLSLGAMLGTRLRVRAALLAVLMAAGFSALTDPWVHGALLMIFVVAGLGLFVVLAWLLARWLGPQPEAVAVAADSAPASVPLPLRAGDAQPPVVATPKLARRVRATR
jgi:hypothetical protein